MSTIGELLGLTSDRRQRDDTTLRALEQMVRERSRQRPPDPPRPLHVIARTRQNRSEEKNR